MMRNRDLLWCLVCLVAALASPVLAHGDECAPFTDPLGNPSPYYEAWGSDLIEVGFAIGDCTYLQAAAFVVGKKGNEPRSTLASVSKWSLTLEDPFGVEIVCDNVGETFCRIDEPTPGLWFVTLDRIKGKPGARLAVSVRE